MRESTRSCPHLQAQQLGCPSGGLLADRLVEASCHRRLVLGDQLVGIRARHLELADDSADAPP